MGPFVKSGGLADISAALPKALVRLGHRVTVLLPRYGSVRVPARRSSRARCSCRSTARRAAPASSDCGREAGVEVVFVDHPPLFDRHAPLRRGRRPAALRLPRARGARVLPQPRRAAERLPRPRLADRARARLPEGVLRGRPDARPHADRVHDPQHRLPGPVRDGHARPARPALEPRHAGRARVPRHAQLPEGRHDVRGAGEHGLADLRPRDPGARARLRLRRRHPLARRRRRRAS